ncbi:MAG: hypothetical protein ILO53_07565 [Clostridia bacterium]|nr:hypothetical protein [Clostridia bacterium]
MKDLLVVKRLNAVILAVICVALVLSAMAVAPAVSAAGTEFDIFGTDKNYKKSSVVFKEGDVIQIQFKTVCDITSIGIEVNENSVGGELLLQLYEWVKNPRDTVSSGKLIASRTVDKWERTTNIPLSFEDLQGGVLPAGEYMFSVKIVKCKDSMRVFWYRPSISGICSYVNDYMEYGAPMGRVTTKEPQEKAFGFASVCEDFPFLTPPPEYEYPEDHPVKQLDVDSTLWTFTDGLGRSNPSYSEAGNRNDKKVGIFYWTWHLNFKTLRPVNIHAILEEYPDAIHDFNHQIWKKNSGQNFWNEPLYGFYIESDDYVLRKHAELLADADIDFVLFDCTNGDATWEEAYMNLLKVWDQARQDGVDTPQVGFMMQFGYTENTLSSLSQVYNKIYRKGLYQDLWFYWEGKPLIMAYNSGLDLQNYLEKEIYDFFTFRAGMPSYFEGDFPDTHWGWLHITPQAKYLNADGSVEMTTVGIAMNANYETMECDSMNNLHNMGRSYSRDPNYSYTYTYRGNEIVCRTGMENSKLYGINFQEQWDSAIAMDPEIIFVTGWNEWIMGRYETWGSVENGFPDQCNDENSRDIEPSKGDLKDYYYYQLVTNVRRFKGVSVPEHQGKAVTIDIGGDFSQWDSKDVMTFNHYANNTLPRNNDGFSGTHYKNPGIRNDFTALKASYDKDYFYFYAETAANITPYTDGEWMRLLIDTGAADETSTDWEDFEYIIGRETGTGSTLSVEKSKGGWSWEKTGDAEYTVSGNKMMLRVKRELLGLTDNKFQLGFKWCDANLKDGDILTLYTDGDAAPGGRFTFRFTNVVTKPLKKGCGSVASGMAAVVLVMALAAAAGPVTVRKKG